MVDDGAALFVDTLGPREFVDERSTAQKLAIGSVEHVEKAIAVRLQQQLAQLALKFGVDDHGCLRRIPIVQIVRRVLIMPAHLAGLGIERHD